MPASGRDHDRAGPHDLEAVEVEQRAEEHQHGQQRDGAPRQPVQRQPPRALRGAELLRAP